MEESCRKKLKHGEEKPEDLAKFMKGRVEGLRNKFEFELQEEENKKGRSATGRKEKEKKEPSKNRKDELLSSGMKKENTENPRERNVNCQQRSILSFMHKKKNVNTTLLKPKNKPEFGLFEAKSVQKSDFSALILREEERQKGRRLGLGEDYAKFERPMGEDLASQLGTKRNRVKMYENRVKMGEKETDIKTEKDR